ncbi:hypothetical protein [Pararhizobium qamdonense]|uniref:hypothetical protein n=1 Tax=Pararhizobium qamdonense TaxID=3031126 RepID=UPI0023E1B870|nr:hypothetical protein [Pararhizobium qamdonense]
MKTLLILALGLLVASCTTSQQSLEPIPGSITYGGQPRTKLMKSPIGSTFDHRFLGANGTRWIETYRIQPDRTVEIVDRRREVEIEFFNHDR